jgi:spore coat protein U-like protein
MKTTLPVLALGFLALSLAVRPADAATASASFSVSATVQASCLAAVHARAIRTYNAAADAASAVSVACSNSALYSVSLDSGPVYDAAPALRPMPGAGFALLGNVLGSDLTGIAIGRQARNYDPTGFGNSSALELAIHGRIPAAQCAQPSAYPDTVIVVVTY